MKKPLQIDTASIDRFLTSFLNSSALNIRARESRFTDALYRYYRNYLFGFGQRLRFFYAQQSYEVQKEIVPEQTKLLEIGCGFATESLWFSVCGANTTGIELSTKRLGAARIRRRLTEQSLQTTLPLRLKNCSLFDFHPDTPFDIIWMEQAFHHIEPRQEAAKKIASLLKPGGKLIISESNALNPLIQAVLFKQRGFQTIKTATDRHGRSVPYGNERILSARTLARTFAEVGIECESVRYFRAFPSHPIFEKLFWLEKRLPQWMVPLFTHYNYVGIKR